MSPTDEQIIALLTAAHWQHHNMSTF